MPPVLVESLPVHARERWCLWLVILLLSRSGVKSHWLIAGKRIVILWGTGDCTWRCARKRTRLSDRLLHIRNSARLDHRVADRLPHLLLLANRSVQVGCLFQAKNHNGFPIIGGAAWFGSSLAFASAGTSSTSP